jgi:hypothetical protein
MADASTVDPEYRRYCAEIDLYEKEARSFVTRGKKVIKLYKDVENEGGKRKRFNVLWSNVQTLLPACYARDPQPVAERRFKDSDPVGRTASEVLERCLAYTIDRHDYGVKMRSAVNDLLLPGRGVHWHRYEAAITDDEVTDERAVPDYVPWQDFGHAVARVWEEVGLLWRKVYMTRPKLVKRFGKEIGGKIPLDYTPKGLKDEKVGEDVKKACIYEIWDKDKGEVVFISKSFPQIIESEAPELKLSNFFPCQRPLFATVTTDSLIPVADYVLYQTQAQEIEQLTVRIDGLQGALKLNGAYDASAPQLAQILQGTGNKLVPVENWAAFSEKGGLEGAIQWVPIKEVAETLIALYEAREKSKHDLYELTGISDIIRGNSEPEETATAQQIKGRFAVLRISDRQADVQRFARDGIRILSEIIAENFSLETIKAISGVKLFTQVEKQAEQQKLAMAQQQAQQTGQPPQPPPPEIEEMLRQPTWEEVHGLLSHQVLREFRIDIETDSTIRTDEEAERAERTEFIAAAGQYMEKAALAPEELKPLAAELLMFGIRGFRSARSLEPVFEDAMKKIAAPKAPQPDPELQKIQVQAEADKELEQIKAQTTIQVAQSEQSFQAQENLHTAQIEDQRAEREAQRQTMLEREKMEMTKELEMFKAKLKHESDMALAAAQGVQADKDRESKERVEGAKVFAGDVKSQRDNSTKREATYVQAQQSEADRESAERTTAAEMDHQSSESEKDRKSADKNAAEDRKIKANPKGD